MQPGNPLFFPGFESVNSQESLNKYYQTLENALNRNYINIHPLNPIYVAGIDKTGRRIVVVTAHALPSSASEDEVLSYLVLKMHRIVCSRTNFHIYLSVLF